MEKARNSILIFGFILLWIGLPHVFGERFAIEKEKANEILHISNETAQCQMIQKRLFHSPREADIQRTEWERFLPFFLKIHLHQYKGYKSDNLLESEFPYGHHRFHTLGPQGPSCRSPLENYGEKDDMKKACGLKQLQEINQVSSERGNFECIVFSIGCGNKWGFEEAVVAQTHCRVETFDCTLGPNAKPPKSIAHRVKLHNICLADRDYEAEGRKYVSWPTLLKLTGLNTVPTFLKMDIEGYEFPVLRSIIDAGEMLPLQIAVELHYVRWERGTEEARKASAAELITFMQYLYKFGGYYLIDRNDNPFCKHCSELLLAKLNCRNHPKPSNFLELMFSSNSNQDKSFVQDVKKATGKNYWEG